MTGTSGTDKARVKVPLFQKVTVPLFYNIRVHLHVYGFSGQFFRIFKINLFPFVVAICALCGDHAWPMLTVNSIWKTFLKYE